jgi:soluble lytic murein transglycosylase-like protein
VNPYDVGQNIQGGVAYLAQLFGQLGDWSLVAIAYNWGPGKLSDYLAGRRGLPGSVASYAAATAGQAFGANVSSDVADAAFGGNGIVWAAVAAAALAIALIA